MEKTGPRAHSHTWGSFAQQPLPLGSLSLCAILYAQGPWNVVQRTCPCAESYNLGYKIQWTPLMISHNVKHWPKAEMIMESMVKIANAQYADSRTDHPRAVLEL